MQKVLAPIQRVRFTKSTLRLANIREKNVPSLGKIQVKNSHQRSPYAVKFEDRSQETERQQRCARSKAWNLAKNMYKLKEKDKAAFYFPAEEWVLTAASTKEPEERVFVVDSGASMHMVSKKDLNSAELETMRTSRSPTTVMTANGEVQTREEATVARGMGSPKECRQQAAAGTSSRRGNTSSESQRRENWAARKGKWSPRGMETTVLTYPCPNQPYNRRQ